MNLTNTTISNNNGIGITANCCAMSLTNTIIANNSGGDCSKTGAFGSGHNIDSDGTCDLKATGDKSNVDPKLGPLADNGGPTLTHALLPGSPAINAIPSQDCVVTRDQRGAFRPQGAGCDIGAYEYVVPGDADGDAEVDLADLRLVGKALGSSGKGDLNLDGVINVLDLVLSAINLPRTGTLAGC